MNDAPSVTAPAAADPDKPPSWFQRLWAQATVRWRGQTEDAALREAVEELIDESSSDDGAPTVEREFLNNIVTFREKEVKDCMIPRADIVAIEIDSEMQDLMALMSEHAHSRIPAYRETLDEAVGIIHMKDVLACLAKGKECKIRELLRPVLFVAPSMPVSKLLMQMRQTRQHMAMVVDEFGGIDGVVTIEDLVEEIIGEIEDEHDDPSAPEVIARTDGSLLVDARMTIEAFESRAGDMLTQEERETIDTLGGYVFHLAGHVPKIGETVAGPGRVLFDVLETDQNRIKRVRVRGVKPRHD